MVRTSCKRGTLVSVSGSGVSSAAHKIGSAAFFAPETRISPLSGALPSMTSLSMLVALGPLFGRQRLHRQGMDLITHAIAQRAIDELVLFNFGQPTEGSAHDDGLEMLTVTDHFDVLASKPCLDRAFDVVRSDQGVSNDVIYSRAPTGRGSARSARRSTEQPPLGSSSERRPTTRKNHSESHRSYRRMG